MKLVADTFPWAQQSVFAYAHDNHNSIVGMREVAMAAGASAMCVVLSSGETLVHVSLHSTVCMLSPMATMASTWQENDSSAAAA